MATFNSSPSYEADEGIVMHGDAVEEPRDEGEGNEREDTSPQKERSVFDDLSLFRDFFISAFSDNVTCCGASESFFSQPPESGLYASNKIAPMDMVEGREIARSGSSQSHRSRQTSGSDSHKHRRKRPLAVAVGFRYAEDRKGRPIIITPGNRRMPVRQGGTPPSPASQSVQITKKSSGGTPPNLFLPLEESVNRRPLAQQ